MGTRDSVIFDLRLGWSANRRPDAEGDPAIVFVVF